MKLANFKKKTRKRYGSMSKQKIMSNTLRTSRDRSKSHINTLQTRQFPHFKIRSPEEILIQEISELKKEIYTNKKHIGKLEIM